jgi:hypothetical protein
MIEKTQHADPKPAPKHQPTPAQPHLKKPQAPVRETLGVPKSLGGKEQKAEHKTMP